MTTFLVGVYRKMLILFAIVFLLVLVSRDRRSGEGDVISGGDPRMSDLRNYS